MKNNRIPKSLRSRQTGITLVEVLVSALIMSIALLGMAGLQSNSLAQQTAANSRGSVAVLVSDIADRLRSNQEQIAKTTAAGVAPAFHLTDTWEDQQESIAAPANDCAASTCTAAQRVGYDMSTWRQKVRTSLPQGSAYIAGDVHAGIALTLMWYDKGFVDIGTNEDALRRSTVCSANLSAGAKSNCCPQAVDAPAGVRCHNVTLVP